MFKLILPYKKSTVECNVLNAIDWQVLQPLFTASTRGRLALKSIYLFTSHQFRPLSIPKRSLQQLLENRWLLLSILEEFIATENSSASIICLDAISWHKRTSYSLLMLLSKANIPGNITSSQLQSLLALLGVTAISNKQVNDNSNRRETLALVQKDQFQLRQVQYTHFGYRLV